MSFKIIFTQTSFDGEIFCLESERWTKSIIENDSNYRYLHPPMQRHVSGNNYLSKYEPHSVIGASNPSFRVLILLRVDSNGPGLCQRKSID